MVNSSSQEYIQKVIPRTVKNGEEKNPQENPENKSEPAPAQLTFFRYVVFQLSIGSRQLTHLQKGKVAFFYYDRDNGGILSDILRDLNRVPY